MKKVSQEELSAHEYLEAFLFPLIPRVNTNPIAHRLLARFGSVHGVFNASIEQLESIEGIGHSTAVYLYGAGKLYALGGGKGDSFFPQRFDRHAFLPFVKREYELISCEVLDVFFLDEYGYIIARNRYTVNEVGMVQLKVEELAEYMLSEKPSGLVLVHNHPSGDCGPSDADNEATRNCRNLCALHNVLFCDHIIYSAKGTFSYYDSGALGE
jgi:DNA repair protein RadC